MPSADQGVVFTGLSGSDGPHHGIQSRAVGQFSRENASGANRDTRDTNGVRAVDAGAARSPSARLARDASARKSWLAEIAEKDGRLSGAFISFQRSQYPDADARRR